MNKWLAVIGGIILIVLAILAIKSLSINEPSNESGEIPAGNILIEQDSSVAGSYGPECANKDYWVDRADWIVNVIVEKVERIDENTTISTSRITQYNKGEAIADTLTIKVLSGYSTSGDMDILLEEGNSVRVYLVDGYKVTGLEEHRGVFGFVCQGVEEI